MIVTKFEAKYSQKVLSGVCTVTTGVAESLVTIEWLWLLLFDTNQRKYNPGGNATDLLIESPRIFGF